MSTSSDPRDQSPLTPPSSPKPGTRSLRTSGIVEQPATRRREGHSALRVRDGKIEKFDPHPLEKEADTRNTAVLQKARPHILPSAGYWFESSRKAQDAGKNAEAVMCMENAYNHVENALAAARGFIESYFVKGALRFPDGRTYREHAKEILSRTGGCSDASFSQNPSLDGQPESASRASSKKLTLTPHECAEQFRMYARANSDKSEAVHQLNFCADFLDEFCSPPLPDNGEATP